MEMDNNTINILEKTLKPEKSKYIRKKCEHNKYSFQCRECNPNIFCSHEKRKNTCKECSKDNFCEHGSMKTSCVICHGGSICPHNKRRTRCVDCKGGATCEHLKLRSRCILCSGSELCEHEIRRERCVTCQGSAICPHGLRKSRCDTCGGRDRCPHQRDKNCCIECDGPHVCEHKRLKYQCTLCKDAKNVCEHGKRRATCITCTPSTACQHCKHVSILSSKWAPYCFRCYCVLNPDAKIPRQFKLREHYVRDALKEHYKDAFTMIFDKTIEGGCSKRRPDILIDMGSHCLIIEIDENRHVNYLCEQKRMIEIYEDLGFRKIVFLRFNPDGYTLGKKLYKSPFGSTKTGMVSINKPEMLRRITELITKIDYYKDNEPPEEFNVDMLFYGDLTHEETSDNN